jgi:hypothetical protein
MSFREQTKVILFLLNNIEFLLQNINTKLIKKLKSYINVLIDTIPFYESQINEKFKLNNKLSNDLLNNIEIIKNTGEKLLKYLTNMTNLKKNNEIFAALYYIFIDNKNKFKKLVNIK